MPKVWKQKHKGRDGVTAEEIIDWVTNYQNQGTLRKNMAHTLTQNQTLKTILVYYMVKPLSLFQGEIHFAELWEYGHTASTLPV